MTKRAVSKPPLGASNDVDAADKLDGRKVSYIQRFMQIANLLWFPDTTNEEEIRARMESAMNMLEAIKPADQLEDMLAIQMIGTHHAALECLRRAMLHD